MLQTSPSSLVPPVVPGTAPMLAISDLHAAYGQSEVLHGLTFSVAQAEIVAVMGRNGMGKTTLMKTLMGIVPVKAGSIRVDGTEIGALKSHARVAKGLAYVPQGRMIFSTMTVQENIETGLTVTGARKVPQDLYEMFPVLLEMKGRRGGNLSGGQQQQLAIARALASKPKVLLLDEPTEGIQPNIVAEIGQTLGRLNKEFGITLILTEQHIKVARKLGDAFLMMENGRIVARGPIGEMTDELIERHMTI